MKPQTLIVALMSAAVLVAAGYGLYRLGVSTGTEVSHTAAGAAQKAADADPAAGKKVLYWHDPMTPGQKFDKPGKSPFMDMDLVPVYADAGNDSGTVTISSRMQQNLGVRYADVTRGNLGPTLEAVGSVAFNDRTVVVVTARAAGFVEKLHVRAPLDPVRKGQALAEIYVPEWVAAQEEYLAVRRMQGQGVEALVQAARQRLLLAGMSEEQARLVESTEKLQPRFTLHSPADGVITELGVREGMTVAVGTVLSRINGLGSIWINAEVPESQIGQIRIGVATEARTAAFPERVFKGRVAAILPDVNPATRTLKARVEVANAGGALAPGMFATLHFTPIQRAAALLVPSEAIISTGTRKVVIVAANGGSFRPIDVETGAESGGQTEIRKGLEAGQKVVVSSQFLIDSEASLTATVTRLTREEPAAGHEHK